MTLASTLTERPDVTISGYNGTGVDIAAGVFVTGTEDAIALPAATTDPILGVTRSIVKAAQRGPVMLRGKAIVTAGVGGTTVGLRVMPEAATGKAAIWTSANSVGGISRKTVAADAQVEVELLGPGATGA